MIRRVPCLPAGSHSPHPLHDDGERTLLSAPAGPGPAGPVPTSGMSADQSRKQPPTSISHSRLLRGSSWAVKVVHSCPETFPKHLGWTRESWRLRPCLCLSRTGSDFLSRVLMDELTEKFARSPGRGDNALGKYGYSFNLQCLVRWGRARWTPAGGQGTRP